MQGLRFEEMPVSWMFIKSKMLEKEFLERRAAASRAAAGGKGKQYKPSFAK